MGFESILDLKEPIKGVTRPAFFLDLNIDQLIERITGKERRCAEYYEYFPLDEECEKYRHDVYNDIKTGNVGSSLIKYIAEYTEFRNFEEKKATTRIDMQRPVWNLYSMEVYTRCIMELKETLENENIKSQGLTSLREFLREITVTSEFIEMTEKSRNLKNALEALELEVNYDNGRVLVSVIESEEESEEDDEGRGAFKEYEDFLKTFDSANEKEFVSPFASTDELTSFEQEIVKIVSKRRPEIFKEADRLYKKINSFENTIFSRLADELRFYLDYYVFQKSMKAKGFEFCYPDNDAQKHFYAKDLYDLALACVNSEKGKTVVSNDFIYDEGELFFVLTGPNQGGKTTFARSLGQLVYFSKIGLDVPASEANVRYFSDILTHFSVEESVETGRGKLMEELVRLSPMMKQSKGNAFVVINELFTTAANYDAIVMGKNVLKHFVDSKCYGIYVTHLRELCDVDRKIKGLSAQLDKNGVQNFKILNSSVDYEGCAKNQVEKYGLAYEKLKERLASIIEA